METVPPTRSARRSQLGTPSQKRRLCRRRLADEGRRCNEHPRHERKPNAFHLCLGHPAQIRKHDNRQCTADEHPHSPVSQSSDGHGCGRPDGKREGCEVGEEEIVVRPALRGAEPGTASLSRSDRRTKRIRRHRRPRRPGPRRHAASTSGRNRRRDNPTANGMTASSTNPYERKAVVPNNRPPNTAKRSDARPSRPVARTTSVTAHAETPAKNASPDDHQMAAGASTTKGSATRARDSSVTSRSATSAAAPAAAPPATASAALQSTPTRPIRALPRAIPPCPAGARGRASCTSGFVARSATENGVGRGFRAPFGNTKRSEMAR